MTRPRGVRGRLGSRFDGFGPDLVAFYEAVDSGGAVAPEMHRYFGFGPVAFVRQWRTLLSHLPA